MPTGDIPKWVVLNCTEPFPLLWTINMVSPFREPSDPYLPIFLNNTVCNNSFFLPFIWFSFLLTYSILTKKGRTSFLWSRLAMSICKCQPLWGPEYRDVSIPAYQRSYNWLLHRLLSTTPHLRLQLHHPWNHYGNPSPPPSRTLSPPLSKTHQIH